MIKLNDWLCINNCALPVVPENDMLEKVFTCACEAFLLHDQSVPEALCHRALIVLYALNRGRWFRKTKPKNQRLLSSQVFVQHAARCPLHWVCRGLFEHIKASQCLDAQAAPRSPIKKTHIIVTFLLSKVVNPAVFEPQHLATQIASKRPWRAWDPVWHACSVATWEWTKGWFLKSARQWTQLRKRYFLVK